MKNKEANIHGILLVNKPKDIVSFKVTKTIEKTLGAKTGHAGTLDPFADGLMLIGINKATRLLEYFSNFDKEYLVTSKWGVETDSLDIDGTVTKKCDDKVSFDQIPECLKSFTGLITQTPPIYSAIKHNGTPLYKLARAGVPITPKSRQITIYNIENTSNDVENNTSNFRLSCSKGTYVRSLVRDIAYQLKNLAHAVELTRTSVANFNLTDAVDFSEISQENLASILKSKAFIPLDEIRVNTNVITLNASEYFAFSQGKQIARNDLHFTETDVINTLFQGKLIGISRISKDLEKAISPIKVFI
ncbi:MAG: tRNA pseudouridine(55) synthase TruB [Rickettsiales bacterium]|nr:tRNA pseudouridine(55) synthase TruB [Rickettsiales bacterium]